MFVLLHSCHMEMMACVKGSDCDLWYPVQKNDQLARVLELLEAKLTSSFKMCDVHEV